MTGVEKALRENGVYVGKTQGNSMLPMLKEGRDTVVVVTPSFPLKKYDVPLYRRDDHLTMHRIVRVTKNGYIICGDNRINLEKDITDTDIIGVLKGFYRDGKYIDVSCKEYISYSKKICALRYLRTIKHYINIILRKLNITK